MLAEVPSSCEQAEERDRWSNRWSFVFAAIGSAIGLGNFWRFPYLTYRWGGGTFLIPYLLSLFFLAIPLLLLELSLGQKMQRGNIASFKKIHPRLYGVGLAAILATFVINAFYAVIISWASIYLIQSFFVPLPWSPAGHVPPNITTCQEAFKGSPAAYHLFHSVLSHYTADCIPASLDFGGNQTMSVLVFGATVAVWILSVICVMQGVKSAGLVVWITMPLPFLLLGILLIRALTLDGAADGVHAYLGRWDLSQLHDPGIWADAAGQIFFSLGVCLGVMVSYGSYNAKDAPITLNTFIIAITNSTFSFFCGFAVFGILGHVAKEKGVPVDDVATSGLTLAFIAYPTALVELPGANFWCILLFSILFFLGIDSSFSMLEAITTVILDADVQGVSLEVWVEKKGGQRAKYWTKAIVAVVVATASCLFGLLFSADVGLYWLDIMDHYVNTYTVMLNGVFEAIVVSWVWGFTKDVKKVNFKSAAWFAGTFGTSVVTLITVSMCLGPVAETCTTTTWRVGNATYTCSAEARDGCSFWEQTINGVPYYAAPASVWAQCSGGTFQNLSLSAPVTFIPMTPVNLTAGCVEPLESVCSGIGSLIVGLAAAIIVLVAGWLVSWKHSGLPVNQWFAAFALSGADELMSLITWVDRDRRTNIPLGSGTRVLDYFGYLYSLAWRFLIKYVIPVALCLLLVRVFKKEVTTPYGGYPLYMHAVCWSIIFLTLILVAVFALLPVKEDHTDASEIHLPTEVQGVAQDTCQAHEENHADEGLLRWHGKQNTTSSSDDLTSDEERPDLLRNLGLQEVLHMSTESDDSSGEDAALATEHPKA